MDYVSIIFGAAKVAQVPGTLLLAICSYESANFTQNYNPMDGGTPSIGICHVKESTAKMLGFRGTAKDLMGPRVNARYAAKYLRWQMNRYGEDNWCKLVSSYNSGTYTESKRFPGKPRNLKYVRRVQKQLDEKLQEKLSCEESE